MHLVFGEVELDIMRALRDATDRTGIANPGKLLPEEDGSEAA